jgi:hypothetical protein
MPYQSIENCRLIGNLRTATLLEMDGVLHFTGF